jgi:hypothetical protein
MKLHTTAEVASIYRCSNRKILETARTIGVGVALKGRAGWRFSDADVEAIAEALRPAAPVARRRRRGAA